MKLAEYRKAIAAAISGAVGLAANFIPGVEAYATPELIAAVATVLATATVYLVPNAPIGDVVEGTAEPAGDA